MRRRVKVGRHFDLKVAVRKSPPSEPSCEVRKPRTLNVGNRWDLQARVKGRPDERIDAVARTVLLGVVCPASLAALALTAFSAWQSKDYGIVAAVWAVVGPIYGSVATYYFAPRRHR